MNRFLLTILSAVCAMTFSLFAQTDSPSAKVALAHNSNLSFFNTINDAQTKAVAGDTIFLSSGAFSGFTVSKDSLTFVGNGRSTIISGNISVASRDNITIDGMRITGNLDHGLDPTNIWVRMCQINGDLMNQSSATNWIIERCEIGRMYVYSGHTSTHIYNSIIKEFYTYTNGKDINSYNSTIDSCNSSGGETYKTTAAFINCIIKDATDMGVSSSMNNCLYKGTFNGNEFDCYAIGEDTEVDESPEALLAAGYLGNDGTIVGPYGGTLVYSENPSLPTVTDRKVSIDPVNRTLNVEIHLTGVQSDPDNN